MSNGLQLGDNGWRSLLFCLIPFWGPHCVSAPYMSGAQKPKGDRRLRLTAAWPCPHSQKPRLPDRGELLSRWLRAGSPDRSVTAGGWACSSTCKNALPVIFHKKYLQHSLGGNPMPLGGGRSPVRKDASSLVFDILLDNCRGYFPDTTGKVSHRTRISFSSNSVWPGKDRIFAKDDVSFLVLLSWQCYRRNLSCRIRGEYAHGLCLFPSPRFRSDEHQRCFESFVLWHQSISHLDAPWCPLSIIV